MSIWSICLKLMVFLTLSYTDIKANIIRNSHILAGFSVFFLINLFDIGFRLTLCVILDTVFLYLLLLICLVGLEFMSKAYLMGGGDLKLLAILYFGFGGRVLFSSLLYSNLLIGLSFLLKIYLLKENVILALLIKSSDFGWKNYRIVFAPFLTLGLILSLVIEVFIL